MIAGDVWAGWDWVSGGGVLTKLQLGPPEYAAVVTMFSLGLVLLNINWVRQLLASERLGSLSDEVTDIIASMEQDSYYGLAMSTETKRKASTLAEKLNRLGVESPAIIPEAWDHWLPRIGALVDTKKLREARKLRPFPRKEGDPPES